jgi:hypothetical protein
MCSIIQSLDNGLDNGLEHQTKSGFGLDNGLDNPDQVWIMEWISVCSFAKMGNVFPQVRKSRRITTMKK